LPNGHQKFLGGERINWFCAESSTLLDRVMSTQPALPAGELCCTFTCDLRGKGEYRIGLLLKEKNCGENVSYGEAILDTAGWKTRDPAQESPGPISGGPRNYSPKPVVKRGRILQEIRTMLEERIYVIVRIALRAACDTLQTTMATLSVTNTETFDVFVWIYDLNTLGHEVVLDGARLNKSATLSVQLQEDGTGNVSYHWAAEQIVPPKAPVWHGTGRIAPPDAEAVVDASSCAAPPLQLNTTKFGAPLPYMFRPYP
jgi:hypothetical protein